MICKLCYIYEIKYFNITLTYKILPKTLILSINISNTLYNICFAAINYYSRSENEANLYIVVYSLKVKTTRFCLSDLSYRTRNFFG